MMHDFEFSAIGHYFVIFFCAMAGCVFLAAGLVIGEMSELRYWAAVGIAAAFLVFMLTRHWFWKRKWQADIRKLERI